jgi:hypothetical protein
MEGLIYGVLFGVIGFIGLIITYYLKKLIPFLKKYFDLHITEKNQKLIDKFIEDGIAYAEEVTKAYIKREGQKGLRSSDKLKFAIDFVKAASGNIEIDEDEIAMRIKSKLARLAGVGATYDKVI